MSDAENVAGVVETVVEQATQDAERRAQEAEQAAKAIAESAILQEQERRFEAFRGEQEQWRENVSQAYSQRLVETTAPIQEALSQLTAQLSKPPEPPPVIVTPPPEAPSTLVPSAEPAMIAGNQSAAAGGQKESPEANPIAAVIKRGLRLL